MAMGEGRTADAIELWQHALVAAPLTEDEVDTNFELPVLDCLIKAFFQTNDIDEMEPLVKS